MVGFADKKCAIILEHLSPGPGGKPPDNQTERVQAMIMKHMADKPFG